MYTLTILVMFSFFFSLGTVPGVGLLNFRSDYTSKDTVADYKSLNRRGKRNRVIITVVSALAAVFSLAALITLNFL